MSAQFGHSTQTGFTLALPVALVSRTLRGMLQKEPNRWIDGAVLAPSDFPTCVSDADECSCWQVSCQPLFAMLTDMSEVVNRVTRYLNSASHVLQLPIAEAMITYKEKRYSRYA